MSRPNRYNPNTGGRDGDGPRARHLTHADLCRLVEAYEEQLRAVWLHRLNDESFLILGDLRRPETLRMVEEQWGKDAPALILDKWGKRDPGDESPPVMAFLQNRSFIDRLGSDGDFAHRECAKELRAVVALSFMGVVPLLVVSLGGVWATQWARPDSKAVVVRYEPETPVESN